MLIFLAVLAAATAIVMLLWNWLMPAIFGLSVITFWQSLGLIVLCRLLLGGFGKAGGMHKPPHFGHKGHMFHHHHSPAEFRAMREKFKQMSKEEREEYIRSRMEGRDRIWGDRCGETAGEGSCER